MVDETNEEKEKKKKKTPTSTSKQNEKKPTPFDYITFFGFPISYYYDDYFIFSLLLFYMLFVTNRCAIGRAVWGLIALPWITTFVLNCLRNIHVTLHLLFFLDTDTSHVVNVNVIFASTVHHLKGYNRKSTLLLDVRHRFISYRGTTVLRRRNAYCLRH